MPPLSMFRNRARPSHMEYGACKNCNNNTSGADLVAAVVARLNPTSSEDSWQNNELKKLVNALDIDAPGVRDELGEPEKHKTQWLSVAGSKLLRKISVVKADGPLLEAYLTIFGIKMAMALYRELVGIALPLDGAAWCQFQLNGSISQHQLDRLTTDLPGYSTLQQGAVNVGDQFAYRYNTDKRSVIAAVAQFHHGLWYTLLASHDQRIIGLFSKPPISQLSGSTMMRPGELSSRVPVPIRHKPMP